MSADTGTDLELGDHGRWDGDVIATEHDVFEWGTHSFPFRVNCFADGNGHVEVAAPSDPPPAAEEIVADAVATDGIEQAVGLVLADGWGLRPPD